MIQVRGAFVVLCLAAFHSSTAQAAWQCRKVNDVDAKKGETQATVRRLCEGLDPAIHRRWRPGGDQYDGADPRLDS